MDWSLISPVYLKPTPITASLLPTLSLLPCSEYCDLLQIRNSDFIMTIAGCDQARVSGFVQIYRYMTEKTYPNQSQSSTKLFFS